MQKEFELLKQTFTFRVDTEEDAVELIEYRKGLNQGTVTYKVDHKVKKSKGEIVDEFWVVSVTHDFTK